MIEDQNSSVSFWIGPVLFRLEWASDGFWEYSLLNTDKVRPRLGILTHHRSLHPYVLTVVVGPLNISVVWGREEDFSE